ncbi:hypothetical protein ONS95_002505 [Cadophora gregata]|uniref:uncharacterized protein n=1 Tax=Cadophora gregata TaxID=51156 RepID=UPI0026DB2246|nr:uncharacterized protein ONS95_002505 [Cadophora gregata]KAK0109834.1 hypothetical protein ONS95_002505 [Cadophora gregata]KAK0110541.1 hypothetical protein ONS96_002147 [Cadophora gregata f. sp. sojae]
MASDVPSRSFFARLQHGASGWRGAITTGLSLAISVLVVNLSMTVWLMHRAHSSSISDEVSIYEGSCGQSKRLSFWTHLAINILSSLLLGSSNYATQLLCAPTRAEVDEAHRKQKWLDIGLWSFRNWKKVGTGRNVLCTLLLVSSIPLHLLYNSVFYSRLAVTDIMWGVVTPAFIDGNYTYPSELVNMQYGIGPRKFIYDMRQDILSWDRISPEDCWNAYSRRFLTARRSVIAVSSVYRDNGFEGPDLVVRDYDRRWAYEKGQTMRFLCNSVGCDIGERSKAQLSTVDYCLSEPWPERCEFNFSPSLMTAVIVCNVIKILCLILILWRHRTSTLVTTGDAIASFLDNADPSTKGYCLLSRDDVVSGKWTQGEAAPIWYSKSKLRWYHAASTGRWWFCYGLSSAVLITSVAFFIVGTKSVPNSQLPLMKYLWSLGFGTAMPEAIVAVEVEGFAANVLFANFPQLILSFLYLTYNGLFTSMLGAVEYGRFSQHRKGLRVSSKPEGVQRSSYYLQLPYTYGIPLITISIVLHWLVSQSLFVVLIHISRWTELKKYQGFGYKENLTASGYSPIALFFVILVSTLTLIGGRIFGCRRLPGDIPLAGGCSVVISAACHPDTTRDGYPGAHSTSEVQWGAISARQSPDSKVVSKVPGDNDTGLLMITECDLALLGDSRSLGHCSFSSDSVESPEKGSPYK